MASPFTYTFDTPSYKGAITVRTGLYIDGRWTEPVDTDAGADIISVVNPATGKDITSISGGSAKDVDIAVKAAQRAYHTAWGLKVLGTERAALLYKLASLVEKYADELAALETLENGKPYTHARQFVNAGAISYLRYFASLAGKLDGNTFETTKTLLAYTRREPYGVVGLITPWNYPLLLVIVKLAPALACGNTVVLKPSEVTPLTAFKLAELIDEAGFPPGVVNIIAGYGNTVGQAISEHLDIHKVSFTGSTLTGRKILQAAAKSNLKNVSLELGGKSPNIVFDDADIEQTLKWSIMWIFGNSGQNCIAGSRIFVQEGIYDRFLAAFSSAAKRLVSATGDPFDPKTEHGPLVSELQFNRVMEYINGAKADGATIHTGGQRHGTSGYFVQPTLITSTTPQMKIEREEVFGPVAVIIKFKTEEEAIAKANDTTYGLSAAVFSHDVTRAIRVAHALESGNAYVNCFNNPDVSVPCGGYKQSGIGREGGKHNLEMYTQIKAVQVNLGAKL